MIVNKFIFQLNCKSVCCARFHQGTVCVFFNLQFASYYLLVSSSTLMLINLLKFGKLQVNSFCVTFLILSSLLLIFTFRCPVLTWMQWKLFATLISIGAIPDNMHRAGVDMLLCVFLCSTVPVVGLSLGACAVSLYWEQIFKFQIRMLFVWRLLFYAIT